MRGWRNQAQHLKVSLLLMLLPINDLFDANWSLWLAVCPSFLVMVSLTANKNYFDFLECYTFFAASAVSCNRKWFIPMLVVFLIEYMCSVVTVSEWYTVYISILMLNFPNLSMICLWKKTHKELIHRMNSLALATTNFRTLEDKKKQCGLLASSQAKGPFH